MSGLRLRTSSETPGSMARDGMVFEAARSEPQAAISCLAMVVVPESRLSPRCARCVHAAFDHSDVWRSPTHTWQDAWQRGAQRRGA